MTAAVLYVVVSAAASFIGASEEAAMPMLDTRGRGASGMREGKPWSIWRVDEMVTQSGSDGACQGCGYTVDLRCYHEYSWTRFHRINNCLVPQYSAITAARQAHGVRCMIASEEIAEVISPLVADFSPRFIDPKQACIKGLHYAVVDSSVEPWIQDRMPLRDEDPHITERLHQDLSADIRSMHRDVAAIPEVTNHGEKYIVLMARREKDRHFDRASEALLAQTLKKATGRDVVIYDGNMSQSSTFAMFRDAEAVVGYHGAGFINTLFSVSRTCVVEISASDPGFDFRGPGFSDHHTWRTNRQLASYSDEANLQWFVYGVPLRQLLEANHVSSVAADGPPFQGLPRSDVDHRVKALSVALSESDVSAISTLVVDCLRSGDSFGEAR